MSHSSFSRQNPCLSLTNRATHKLSATHTPTMICAFGGDKAAAYAMADSVTCADWLRLETKAAQRNSLAPLKVFILHKTTGADSLNCLHPHSHLHSFSVLWPGSKAKAKEGGTREGWMKKPDSIYKVQKNGTEREWYETESECDCDSSQKVLKHCSLSLRRFC